MNINHTALRLETSAQQVHNWLAALVSQGVLIEETVGVTRVRRWQTDGPIVARRYVDGKKWQWEIPESLLPLLAEKPKKQRKQRRKKADTSLLTTTDTKA